MKLLESEVTHMDTYYKIIKDIAETSDGIITTKQVEVSGLSRTILKPYVDDGLLVKESQGIYSLSDTIADEYKRIQIRSEKAIFSYGTTLYLLGMSDRVPHSIDITVPQGYNVSRMKKPEQLKGAIKNIAKDKKLRPQEELQMFLFECILERLSLFNLYSRKWNQ